MTLTTWSDGIQRPYSQNHVDKLKGSLNIEYTIAKYASTKFRKQLKEEPFIKALGCLTGMQAVQCVRAGLNSIYVSGWQIAADQNLNGETYPDQSLYSANSIPFLIKRINKALQRADQIEHSEGGVKSDWYAPILADAEAGFGGPLNVFELTKSMIEAGVAGVHFEDQLSSAKKCGHMGGKVLIPISHFIRTLVAARLAADVCNVSTIIIARTDAYSARLLTSDIDEVDKPFINGTYVTNPMNHAELLCCPYPRTKEGYHQIIGGLDMAIARGLAYAPYADLLWCETSIPSLEEAEKFANGIHAKYPGKMLAYNCSPSFNWSTLDSNDKFQNSLADLGYKFQFVTLAGFHTLNHSMYDLALDSKWNGISAYRRFQEKEFEAQKFDGYTAVKHQREVGTGYFDKVMETIGSSNISLAESTEEVQF